MATLHCNCGKTCIKLATTIPRSKTVCCCDDCFDRFNVLHKHFGGPACHAKNLPALYCTFDNNLVVESGDIFFFKVTPVESPTPINMASKCCNTCLMGYFEPYHHNCVAINSPERGAKIDGADCDATKYSFISFRHGKERFDDMLEREPQFKGVPEIWLKGEGMEEGFDGTPKWEERLMDVTSKLSEPAKGQPSGKTFDDLLEERGGKEGIVVLAK